MSQSLVEKLELENDKNVLIQGLPSTIEKHFSKISFSKNVTPLLRNRKLDFALIFVLNANHLNSILSEVCPALQESTKFWVASPKRTSKIITDLSRAASWNCMMERGLEGGDVVELDYVWSAQRYYPAGKARKCGHTEEEGVELVDVEAEEV